MNLCISACQSLVLHTRIARSPANDSLVLILSEDKKYIRWLSAPVSVILQLPFRGLLARCLHLGSWVFIVRSTAQKFGRPLAT